MLSHEEVAENYLLSAEDGGASPEGQRRASLATAHAVLALIDIIAGDRETETQQLYAEIVDFKRENGQLKYELNQARLRVRELADQLDGCNDTVRRHEQAATANTNPNNNDLRKSYE